MYLLLNDTYSTNILVRLLTANMKNCLTRPKSEKVRPHSSNSIENATPSSGTSPLASYKEIPSPPPGCACCSDLTSAKLWLFLAIVENSVLPRLRLANKKAPRNKLQPCWSKLRFAFHWLSIKLGNVIIDQIRFYAFGGGLISSGGGLYSDVFFVYR